MFRQLTHILFDAARMGEQIDEAKEQNKSYDSLYRGDSEESLAAVAPYIFQFSYSTPFAGWYLDNGWGDSWGVLLKSSCPIQELHKHFRKFLLVKTEEGEELYSRFYDPRVLRIFLPTCDAMQIRAFFGPVDYFLMEDEDPAFALQFRHENGILKQERLKLEDIAHRSVTSSSDDTAGDALSANKDVVTTPVREKQQINPKLKSKWNLFD